MLRLALGLLFLLLRTSAIAEVVQMQPHGGGYLIPGRVNSAISLDLVLDTGASDVLIPGEVAQALVRAGTLGAGDFIGTQTYVLADGSRVPSKRIILHELRVGGQRVANVTASIGPAGSQPLLGQSFLSRFPSWMLDNERHVLVLATSNDTIGLNAPVLNAPAQAHGALNYGSFARDDASGQFGLSWGTETQRQADELAMKDCVENSCKIIFRTRGHQCGAIATSEKQGSTAWGGAVKLSRDAAALAALTECEKRTSGQCKVRASGCNR